MFAVIEIYQIYEDIGDVKYLKTFNTTEEASEFIELCKNEFDANCVKYRNYVQEYVKNLNITTQDEIKEYYTSIGYKHLCNSHSHLYYFKEYLNEILMQVSPKIEGFNPPQVDRRWMQYYICEVPNE